MCHCVLSAGAVPQLVTAWQGIARAESQKAVDNAAALYISRFQYQGITEENALYNAHQAALDAAVQEFKAGVVLLFS